MEHLLPGLVATPDSPEDFGAILRRRRKALGLTQDDLAAALGTIRQRVAELEQGRPSARLALALRAARELGIAIRLDVQG